MPAEVSHTSQVGLTLPEAAELLALKHLLSDEYALAYSTAPHDGGLFVQLLRPDGVVAAVGRVGGKLAVMDFHNELLGASGGFDTIGDAVEALRTAYGPGDTLN